MLEIRDKLKILNGCCSKEKLNLIADMKNFTVTKSNIQQSGSY